MKRVKDEEKFMGPLFPRLHINDTEKGGPRAPPRNKMALYEQLSVPSQRLSSGSVLPSQPNNISSLALSKSSNQERHTRTVISPFFKPPSYPHLPERISSRPPNRSNVSSSVTSFEQQPLKPTTPQKFTAMDPFSTSARCSLFQPHNISKNSSPKKFGDENDFSVPTITRLGRISSGGYRMQNMENEEVSTSSPKYFKLFQASSEKHGKHSTTDLKSRQHLGNQREANPSASRTREYHAKNISSVLSNGEKMVVNGSSSPLSGDMIPESMKRARLSLNQEKKNSLVDSSRRKLDFNEQSHQECKLLQENKVLKDDVYEPEKDVEKRVTSTSEKVPYSRSLLRNVHQNHYDCEKVGESQENQEYGSSRDVERNEDVLPTSKLDSLSEFDISPDDVVEVIGRKQFWNARRAIVHQQRIFAVQVFELHRLVKVQRLIAGSPNVLLEDNIYFRKPSFKVSPSKNMTSEYVIERPTLTIKAKEGSPMSNSVTECATELAVEKPPFSSENIDCNEGLFHRQSNNKPCTGNSTSASVDPEKPSPWCFQPPPSNQWLVPVMSPSEGLVYKPYPGPCPPSSSFMPPLYGSCGPMGIAPLMQTYFPPYGMPVMNPSSFSSSAVEQKSPHSRYRSYGPNNQLSSGDFNGGIPHKGSRNISSKKSGVISFHVRNFQGSKESELLDSTASSPGKLRGGDALPLFPTAPTGQDSEEPIRSHTSERRTQVIKVVPHNPRSAPESAARIFQFIQEERKQHE